MGLFGKKKKADPIPDSLLKLISFEVDGAYLEDRWYAIARIDNFFMQSYQISDGDIIEIKGKRRTVARCFPLDSRDEDKGIIRIDALVRNNLGVGFGEQISIQKLDQNYIEEAIKIVFAPLSQTGKIPDNVDESDLVDYFPNCFDGIPLIKHDNVLVNYHNQSLGFQVIGTLPFENVCVVSQKTIFYIAKPAYDEFGKRI